MQTAAWILVVALLFVTGLMGVVNAARDWDDPASSWQRSVTIGVALYGILGVVGAVGLGLRRTWSVIVAAAWAVTITYVGSVASFAFSDPSFSREGTLVGVIASGVASALIGAFVVWTARRATGGTADPSRSLP